MEYIELCSCLTPALCWSCSSWTNKLITAKDHASVQINVGHLNDEGVFDGNFSTFALAGNVRAMVRTYFSARAYFCLCRLVTCVTGMIGCTKCIMCIVNNSVVCPGIWRLCCGLTLEEEGRDNPPAISGHLLGAVEALVSEWGWFGCAACMYAGLYHVTSVLHLSILGKAYKAKSWIVKLVY